jgi:alpha-mannosidase
MREYRDRQRNLDHLRMHLRAWAEELQAWERGHRAPITTWTVTPEGGAPRPFALGQAWPTRHGITTFESGLVDPTSLAGEVELWLDFGGEAMVRLFAADGTELQAFGANPKHKRFAPVPDQPFRIRAEVAARSLFGIPNRDPKLELAELAQVYPATRRLRRSLEVIADTTLAIPPDPARALVEVAEIALSELRLPTATATLGPRLADQPWARTIWERSFEPTLTPEPPPPVALASIDAALARLQAGLADLRALHPKVGQILTTGHAHIDYVWLWPQPETERKILRTFTSVDRLMGAHPDFTFIQSSSLFYEHMEEMDPAALARIKARVAEGRWEITGGMFIECDTNMPSAEAFTRQFLYGQSYFARHFGQICKTAWLPDTFGFTAAMPQIMAHCGIETLFTIKVSWNETNKMPDNIFRWQGNDGTRVLVHTFDAYQNDGYNMFMKPQALEEVWRNHAGKDLSPVAIATYGWGDGGGGPDPDQIDSLPLLNQMPVLPEIAHGNFQAHFDQLQTRLKDAAVPVWSGELYLEYHRATLTTQAHTKQNNRRAERALVAAEALTVLADLHLGTAAPLDLTTDWKLTLRNQFHDILPGSSIREAYIQTEAEMTGVIARAEALAAARLADLAGVAGGNLAIANLSGVVLPQWQIAGTGTAPATAQATPEGWVLTGATPLAPLSVTLCAPAGAGAATVSGRVLENALVRATIDDQGRIASLYDKRQDRETLDGPGNRLMVTLNDLPRTYDAWDIEPGFALSEQELIAVETIETTASGPHLAEITVTRRIGASTLRQSYRLWANSPRLEVVTDIDWHDRRTYVRAAFPLTVLSDEAVFDQAIGVTRRATHDNTSWQRAQFEGSGHRFASLSETDFGAAILSADKYGFSAKGNVLTISLIRGPMYPDMLADEGHHRFTYALLPHDGRWWSAAVQAEAELLSDPLRHAPTAGTGQIRPIAWTGPDLRFHALKRAEDGQGHVLRLSETGGRRGKLAFHHAAGLQAQAVDGLERPVADGPKITPFHLVSRRFGPA